MNKFVAQIQTTLYVMGQRLEARAERGQTTAEYVGIVAFVALLAVAVIKLAPTFAGNVSDVVGTAFTKIKDELGS